MYIYTYFVYRTNMMVGFHVPKLIQPKEQFIFANQIIWESQMLAVVIDNTLEHPHLPLIRCISEFK